MTIKRFPIVVVGAGPSGLLASVILSQSGIEHLLVEKRTDLHRVPAAHVLKTRTLEIYRQFGISDAVQEAATPLEDQRYVSYFDQLAGLSYGKLDLAAFRSDEAFEEKSPTRAANLPQDKLEEILLGKAQEGQCAEIEFGVECIGHIDDGDKVEVTLRGEDGKERVVETSYLISAEGAGSATRKRLGINMEGPAALAHYITVYFRTDLSGLLEGREGIVHWCLNLDTPGALIVHGIEERAVFMIPYDPSVTDPAKFTKEFCVDYLRNVIGDEDHPFEIVSVGKWTMAGQVALHYSSGRVFLVGDAAHRFPPTGGLGLNTGAQDVFNLLWKMREVLRGNAFSSLLETYETECRPIARTNCEHSKINHRRTTEVPEAIGLTADRKSAERIIELLRQGGLGSEAKFAHIARTIEGQLRHYVSPGLDLSFVYEDGAVVCDGTPPVDRLSDPTLFEASAQPGAKLPHVALRKDGRNVSSHDLVDYNRLTLFVGANAHAWKSGLVKLGSAASLIKVFEVGGECEYRDVDGQWREYTGLSDSGALLVRPDGHVAWRAKSAPKDVVASLERALTALHLKQLSPDRD